MGLLRSTIVTGLFVLLAACTPSTGNEPAPSSTSPSTTSSVVTSPVDLSRRPLVWLTPQPYISISDFEGGSTDFFETFEPGAEWETAARRVHVFQLYDQLGLVDDPPGPDEWRRAVEGIQARGMALAMELGPLRSLRSLNPARSV
jgi:hypothetical protein